MKTLLGRGKKRKENHECLQKTHFYLRRHKQKIKGKWEIGKGTWFFKNWCGLPKCRLPGRSSGILILLGWDENQGDCCFLVKPDGSEGGVMSQQFQAHTRVEGKEGVLGQS